MHQIDIRKVDLNLLVVFDVLMRECHVSRAAHRLARSQSAVSHALARLREQLNDPLLINSRGGMRPTPFAERVHERVAPLLQGLQASLSPEPAFDPAATAREFRFAAPDFATGLLVPLWSAFSQQAPNASVICVPAFRSILSEIAVGAVDLALVPQAMQIGEDLDQQPVGSFGWRCFAAAGHSAFRRWGRASWARHPHLVVQTDNDVPSPVAQVLSALGLQRRVAMRVSAFSAVGPLLAGSTMLATLPEVTLSGALERYGLDSRPVPFEMPGMPHKLVWGRRFGSDPQSRWFRELALRILDDVMVQLKKAHAHDRH